MHSAAQGGQGQELPWLIQLREFRVALPAARPEMADENEELPADEELPAPAEEGFEQLENDSPAERSGHVAVTDGRCMYVWGGYKVQLPCAGLGIVSHPPGRNSGELFLPRNTAAPASNL